MAAAFMSAFTATATVIGYIAGAAAAIALAASVFLLGIILAGSVFDWLTARLGRRWKQRGHSPKSRIAKIILAHADGI